MAFGERLFAAAISSKRRITTAQDSRKEAPPLNCRKKFSFLRPGILQQQLANLQTEPRAINNSLLEGVPNLLALSDAKSQMGLLLAAKQSISTVGIVLQYDGAAGRKDCCVCLSDLNHEGSVRVYLQASQDKKFTGGTVLLLQQVAVCRRMEGPLLFFCQQGAIELGRCSDYGECRVRSCPIASYRPFSSLCVEHFEEESRRMRSKRLQLCF